MPARENTPGNADRCKHVNDHRDEDGNIAVASRFPRILYGRYRQMWIRLSTEITNADVPFASFFLHFVVLCEFGYYSRNGRNSDQSLAVSVNQQKSLIGTLDCRKRFTSRDAKIANALILKRINRSFVPTETENCDERSWRKRTAG